MLHCASIVTLPKRTALAGAFGVCVGLLVCAIAASVSQLQHQWPEIPDKRPRKATLKEVHGGIGTLNTFP